MSEVSYRRIDGKVEIDLMEVMKHLRDLTISIEAERKHREVSHLSGLDLLDKFTI